MVAAEDLRWKGDRFPEMGLFDLHQIPEGDSIDLGCENTTPGESLAPENTSSNPEHKLELELTSVDGTKKARNYQEDGVKWALARTISPINPIPVKACIADQMRLGKTPQALLIAKNLLKMGKVKKILIVVKSANLWQWVDEHKCWLTALPNGIWAITGGARSFIPEGFTSYVISMDSLRNLELALIAMNFDLVIADEAHSFKNTDAARTISLNNVIKRSGIEHLLFLTGTPVKNRADEYFTILHHCAPKEFRSLDGYRARWLQQDDKGRYSRLQPRLVEPFRETIAPYVLRREKEDVYTDLPEFNTMYTSIKIDDERLKKLYNTELDKMEESAANGKINYLAMNDHLMVLRRLCGMAKVPATLDYITEFIEESDDQKIAIGIHHQDVRRILEMKLPKSYGVVTLSGEDSAQRKYDIQERVMKRSENRVLLINTLAGGVGMDFHYINNFLVTERQWNGADESQFEFRFYNPDKSIKHHSTFGEYFIAKGTIDEFWHRMVENKKLIARETSENNWDIRDDENSFKQLIMETMENRLV